MRDSKTLADEFGGKTYISGPMTGIPEYNAPAFNAAAAALRARGVEVVNPAEFGEVEGLVWSDYLRKDIRALMDCHAIYMLPGWENSKGARLENHIARELGMQVIDECGAAVVTSERAYG